MTGFAVEGGPEISLSVSTLSLETIKSAGQKGRKCGDVRTVVDPIRINITNKIIFSSPLPPLPHFRIPSIRPVGR